MNLIELTCPNCGAHLQVDSSYKQATCSHCGTSMLIDDGTQHIKYDNAEEAGYQFEKGRQRAQAEAKRENTVNANINQAPEKKRKTWLWVLGWIFIFPVPLTIIMLRRKDLNAGLRYGVIAAAWIVYFIIGLSGGSDSKKNDSTSVSSVADSSVNSTEAVSATDDKTPNSSKSDLEQKKKKAQEIEDKKKKEREESEKKKSKENEDSNTPNVADSNSDTINTTESDVQDSDVNIKDTEVDETLVHIDPSDYSGILRYFATITTDITPEDIVGYATDNGLFSEQKEYTGGDLEVSIAADKQVATIGRYRDKGERILFHFSKDHELTYAEYEASISIDGKEGYTTVLFYHSGKPLGFGEEFEDGNYYYHSADGVGHSTDIGEVIDYVFGR